MVRRISKRWSPTLSLVALAYFAIHCSSNRAEFEAPADAGQSGSFIAPVEAGADANADADAEVQPPEDCGSENKVVYVVSPNPDAIYRFDPETLQFTRLGYLDCLHAGSFSMAVDRKGFAWILFSDGAMVKVRLDNLQCTQIALRNKDSRLGLFGMGFAKDDSITGETLYLHKGYLLKVDPSTLEVTSLGQPVPAGGAELTGTGAGELFGYWPYNGTVSRIDKETGVNLETYRTSAVDANDWAFAQWGGDFWIFSRLDPAPSAKVTRFSPASNESTVVVPDVGFRIVGAGVSTCAPYLSPK
ncbi:hypothetical protein AKJ09_00321 [Labilithrix luteola]|uniref:Uncharacterized protein n=1 Tax=Labilithrix luteola TaxID=1391654 RepID=A0A0K1PJF7_9BACT|nr:hypothetical protein [Labilithrix luteola]AKU93657.1 hypothetical protein AKJ09_00321 [Labilithrix luteola]